MNINNKSDRRAKSRLSTNEESGFLSVATFLCIKIAVGRLLQVFSEGFHFGSPISFMLLYVNLSSAATQ